jgi:hypothetical protein
MLKVLAVNGQLSGVVSWLDRRPSRSRHTQRSSFQLCRVRFNSVWHQFGFSPLCARGYVEMIPFHRHATFIVFGEIN